MVPGVKNDPLRRRSRHDDDADPRLRLSFVKYIRFMELDGSPGLTYRKGKTNHSYRWMSTARSHQKLELRLRN